MEIIHVAYPFHQNINSSSVACIGYFDGLHIGHQKLIEKTISLANTYNCIPACICFDKDPWEIIYQRNDISHIVPIEERLYDFEKIGIKRCFMLHFDEHMMNLSKEVFIKEIIEKLHLQAIVCGNDFHFAKKGEGSYRDLKNVIETHVIDTIMKDNSKVSSSAIEKLLQTGKVEEANLLLFKPYQIKGKIIHGNKKGSSVLGFPTANLKPSYLYVIPKRGVYFGYAYINQKAYKAMINIGHNPTMNYKDQISIEAYIFDFNNDIYGKEVIFEFRKYIRKEKKFNNKEELIKQLQADKKHIQAIRM